MKCVSCGLPLSPTRTHCPRCGTAANGEPAKQNEWAFNQTEVPQYAFPYPQGGGSFSDMQANAEAAQSAAPSWQNQNAQDMPFPQQASPMYQMASNEATVATTFPPQPASSSGQLDQSWLPSTQGAPQGQAGADPQYGRPTQGNSGMFPQTPPPPPQQAPHSNNKHPARLRLTIAGLCVLTGGLILILVYIVSVTLSVSLTNNQSTHSITPGLSPAAQGTKANTTTTNQLTPTVTPTMSLPGQQYIDTAQMASSVNPNTAQPIQVTKDFKLKQQVFVTFMLHPQNSGGAVCLLWYLNQTQFSQYAFSVNSMPQLAYSYAYPGGVGSGSVEIYWASTTACTDKTLAQVVNFTVNA